MLSLVTNISEYQMQLGNRLLSDSLILGGYSVRNKLLRSPQKDIFEPSFSAKLSVLGSQQKFCSESMTPQNPKWSNAISRLSDMKMPVFWGDAFSVDKNLIMNSEGYDRLRYKAMVYPLPQNDMITTRSTHVSQVANIAEVISNKLGLNIELTSAIAHGHDIGHSPFGHDGERAINLITKEYDLPRFLHEKNGIRMADRILIGLNEKGESVNLNLTYAVRDGIISHCGEMNQNFIKPRDEFIQLDDISKPAQYQPYTWEGAVVKIADKIAYLGRDIEDAVRLGVYNEKNLTDLNNIVKSVKPEFADAINSSSLVKLFIEDIVKNSTPQKGIGFSNQVSQIMDSIKKYNTENIYVRDDVRFVSQSHTNCILATIFKYYDSLYNGKGTINNIDIQKNEYNKYFKEWLIKYTDNTFKSNDYKNKVLYDLDNQKDYRQAIVDYISGMTDSFAIKSSNSLH